MNRTHLFTCSYTSIQNGRVERKHRQIVESGLTLLAQAEMPWWEAIDIAAHINRLPSSPLNNETPLEILFKRKPDYNSYNPFGCAIFSCPTPFNKQKLQFHSQKCLFIGYSNNHKSFLSVWLQMASCICLDMFF